MPKSHHVILDEFEDLIICLNSSAGIVLFSDDDGVHRCALKSGPDAAKHGNDDLLVTFRCQPVRVDDWQV